MPRLSIANAGPDPITMHFKGPCPRSVVLPGCAKDKPPVVRELAVFPGDYDVAFEIVKGKEHRVARGTFRFALGIRYGFVTDGAFALTLPKPEKK